MNKKLKTIYFADDESSVRDAVELTLKKQFNICCYEFPKECLEDIMASSECDLLITDINMPEMNGIELLQQAKKINPSLPVLVVTGYGDVEMAVKAMKAGAANFLEKPLEKESLLNTIRTVIQEADLINPYIAKQLTKTEKNVLQLMLCGKNNKQIALLLHRSVRTIEDHRHNIMQKLNVTNVVDLVKTALKMDV